MVESGFFVLCKGAFFPSTVLWRVSAIPIEQVRGIALNALENIIHATQDYGYIIQQVELADDN